MFCVVLTPSVQEAGCCKQEAGISLETRPSSSSLSESEMTSGGFGTVAPAGLHCWTKPLGPGSVKDISADIIIFIYLFLYKVKLSDFIKWEVKSVCMSTKTVFFCLQHFS